MKISLLLVEGVHDVAVVQRVLEKGFGLRQEKIATGLPNELQKIIPSHFPTNERHDMTDRVDVPYFHFSGEGNGAHWLVLQTAKSDNQMINTLALTVAKFTRLGIVPFFTGFIVDSDNDFPEQRFEKIRREWQIKLVEAQEPVLQQYQFPASLESTDGNLRVFVMPDNLHPGRLESLLLERGKTVYPALHKKAAAYINTLKQTPGAIPDEGRHTEFKKQKNSEMYANDEKAVLHAMYGVFRPCKTLQASIAVNKWIPDNPAELYACAALKPLVDFLRDNLGL